MPIPIAARRKASQRQTSWCSSHRDPGRLRIGRPYGGERARIERARGGVATRARRGRFGPRTAYPWRRRSYWRGEAEPTERPMVACEGSSGARRAAARRRLLVGRSGSEPRVGGEVIYRGRGRGPSLGRPFLRAVGRRCYREACRLHAAPGSLLLCHAGVATTWAWPGSLCAASSPSRRCTSAQLGRSSGVASSCRSRPASPIADDRGRSDAAQLRSHPPRCSAGPGWADGVDAHAGSGSGSTPVSAQLRS